MTTQTTEITPSPMPVWLSIPIILVCLFSGGWIIHWYVMTDPISHESNVLGDAAAQANWQLPGNRIRQGLTINSRRYVQDKGNGQWELRTEQTHAEATVANGKTTFRILQYNTNSYGFVPDSSKSTIFAARPLLADTKRIEALKLTPQQVKQLRPLVTTINMVVTPQDREMLAIQTSAYVAAKPADRPALEIKLLQLLDDVAEKSKAATKQQVIDRAKQINSIITPEMWKLDTAMGGAK